ncbi:hypothetical protein BS78_07G086700 [Paspalum vaginatum]|nr:hypothetical protein BS78_07G086700 [Paspalum vaginatum]
MDNTTGDGSVNTATSPVLCKGEGCEAPAQPQPIYGYPPPAPSLPYAPPSAPGSKTPCAPVAVVCCGGAEGQYMPQQPNYKGPPTGYAPYYNASVSPPALLVPPAGYYVLAFACASLLWAV